MDDYTGESHPGEFGDKPNTPSNIAVPSTTKWLGRSRPDWRLVSRRLCAIRKQAANKAT
jgi:hypothetical protein